jgi:hypothetical protein
MNTRVDLFQMIADLFEIRSEFFILLVLIKSLQTIDMILQIHQQGGKDGDCKYCSFSFHGFLLFRFGAC